jgi:hypothetical protein
MLEINRVKSQDINTGTVKLVIKASKETLKPSRLEPTRLEPAEQYIQPQKDSKNELVFKIY